MYLTQLEIEKFKRIRAVTITPDGNIVDITGRNAQGKSSVLDAIEFLFGGASHAPDQPLRNGEEKGRIVGTLDDGSTVRRTFNAKGGGTLTIENADGLRYGSPQEMLDKLYGRLTFDPLAFTRMEPKKQLDELRKLVGLDFGAADANRADRYAERTAANRVVAQHKARLDATPLDPGAPEAEVSVSALASELEAANGHNAKLANVDRKHAEKRAVVTEMEHRVMAAERALADAKEQLRLAMEDRDQFFAKVRNLPPKVDVAPIRERILSADAMNARVRRQTERKNVERMHADAVAESERLTRSIEEIDAKKRSRLEAAKFPVEGLSLGDAGVTYNGVPFAQASSAERIRVSAAICLAMNPKLRVMLIRDGSLLDREGMAQLVAFAAEHQAQVWIERVTNGESVGIVIEDGMVDGAENPVPDEELE